VSLLACFCKYINRKKTMESLPGAQAFWHCMQKREAPLYIRREGSLTVEAAVILPLFAAFFSYLLFFFQIMNVQLVVQGALEETAKKIAVLSVKELEEPGKETDYLLMAKGLLCLKLNEEAEILGFVRGGIPGVSLMNSDFGKDGICLQADYVIRFPIELFEGQNFQISQSAYYRKWNGCNGTKIKNEVDELVYITEYGKVYHVKRSCPYLTLSIRKVLRMQLDNERNKSGERYEECEVCCEKNNYTSVVYVTDYGDKYHDTMTCSGLKRTIYQKRISDVGGMHACGKCVK